MNYCTIEDIKEVVKITPSKLSLDKTDNTKMEEIIEKWISQSTSIINSYIRQSFEPFDETKEYSTEDKKAKARKENEDALNVMQNVCTRMVANMIAFHQVRRDTPIITNDGWKGEMTSDRIFSNNLKFDLNPYKLEKSMVSDKIDFFTVSGD